VTRPGFAFLAGVTTFFAPCAFPLLPGYVAYFLGREAEGSVRLRRAAVVGGTTVVGFFLVYGVLAGTVAAVGASALGDIALLEPVIGVGLILLGGLIALGWTGPTRHVHMPERRRSLAGYLGFGVVYALAAAGCTAPIFVAVALLALSGGPVAAAVTLGAYAAGMAGAMLVVTAVSAVGRGRLIRGAAGGSERLRRATGVLLALAGVAQIYLYVFDFDPLGGLRALGFV
jgi:cytochrome c-type biogenesis protein